MAEAKRKAVAVDVALKKANLTRLRRIEGQVRGIARMVEEERYCADIVAQVASVQQALRGVSRNLLRNHLQHCTADALRKGGTARRDAVVQEWMDMVYRHLA